MLVIQFGIGEFLVNVIDHGADEEALNELYLHFVSNKESILQERRLACHTPINVFTRMLKKNIESLKNRKALIVKSKWLEIIHVLPFKVIIVHLDHRKGTIICTFQGEIDFD